MKKITRWTVICIIMMLLCAQTAEAANYFSDVSNPSDYYYTPVYWAADHNITSGTAPGIFSPHKVCTRGQVVTFLWRAKGSPRATNRRNPFRDVSGSSYYYESVLWAVEKNITSGTSANMFSPDAPCTRGQVVTFLWRAMNRPAGGSASFSDVSGGSFYADAVRWAVQSGVTSGTSAGAFSPNAPCTRGQVVTFLYRALGSSPTVTPGQGGQYQGPFTLNTNSKKIHRLNGPDVGKISPKNKAVSNESLAALQAKGYTLCRNCFH